MLISLRVTQSVFTQFLILSRCFHYSLRLQNQADEHEDSIYLSFNHSNLFLKDYLKKFNGLKSAMVRISHAGEKFSFRTVSQVLRIVSNRDNSSCLNWKFVFIFFFFFVSFLIRKRGCFVAPKGREVAQGLSEIGTKNRKVQDEPSQTPRFLSHLHQVLQGLLSSSLAVSPSCKSAKCISLLRYIDDEI